MAADAAHPRLGQHRPQAHERPHQRRLRAEVARQDSHHAPFWLINQSSPCRAHQKNGGLLPAVMDPGQDS
jgi:hypothetical protein